MKKFYISTVLAASLITSLNAGSLKDTVTQTIQANSEILSNQLKIKAAKKDIEIQKGGYFPTLDLEAYIEKSQTQDHRKTEKRGPWAREDGGRATLKASQLLYDGGSTPSKVEEKEYNFSEAMYKYTQSNEEVIFDVIETYTNLVKNDELMQLLTYGDKAHKDALDVAHDKEEISGEALETLKTLNLITVHEDKKIALKNDITKDESKFRTLTKIGNIGTLCRPNYDPAAIPDNLHDLVNLALENSYKIKEQKAIIKEQQAVISQEDAKFRPDFRLNVSAAYDEDLELDEDGEQKELIGQVMMNWNFYNGGRDASTHDREKIRLNEEKRNLERTTHEVVESVTNLFNTYKHAQTRVTNFEKAIKAHQEVLELTKDQQEDGTKTFIDLLQVKNKVLEVQSNKIKQEFVVVNTYYKLLAELSMLSKNVVNSENQVCMDKKVPNLIDSSDNNNNNSLDELLDADSSLNSENTPTEVMTEEKSEPVQAETKPTDIVNEISELFSTNRNVNFNRDNLTITIRTEAGSFTRGTLNKNSNFASKLESFSSDFMEILDKNKEQVRALHVEAHTSSEYRSVQGLENKFKANVVASKKRANRIKQYIINKSIQNNLDTRWFDRNTVAIGKGPKELINDINGVENKEASRRVIIKLIKR